MAYATPPTTAEEIDEALHLLATNLPTAGKDRETILLFADELLDQRLKLERDDEPR